MMRTQVINLSASSLPLFLHPSAGFNFGKYTFCIWWFHHFYVASRINARPLGLASQSVQSGLVSLTAPSVPGTLILLHLSIHYDLTCLVLFLALAASS